MTTRFEAVVGPAIAATLLAAGCDTADSTAWRGSVDTLSTGVVLVRNPAEGAWGQKPWRLVQDLRIGAVDGGGPEQFGRVVDVTADLLGRLYVLEGQAKEVRVFAGDGSHIRSFGRAGEGPGELGRPLSLDWGPEGRLWIADFGNRRYSVFDTTGAHVVSHRFATASFGFGNAWGAEGLLHERAVDVAGGNQPIMVRRRLVADTLALVDTLSVPELAKGQTIEATVRQSSGSFTTDVPVPLAPTPMRAGGRRGWWITDAGTGYRIAELDLRGNTVRVVERAYEPVPISHEELQRALAEELPEGAEVPESLIPSMHPPVIKLLPGEDGLWVKRRTAKGRTGYEVFDPEGRYSGELAADLPLDRLRITERTHDTVIGILEDELDVPYVVRLRIVRPH